MIRLHSDQEVYKKYNINPMQRNDREISNEVTWITDRLPNEFEVFKKELQDLLVETHLPANFYRLPRIHKESSITHNIPLCPMVSIVGNFHRLAARLAKHLIPHVATFLNKPCGKQCRFQE